MTGVQTCALPICFPVTIRVGDGKIDENDEMMLVSSCLRFLRVLLLVRLRVVMGRICVLVRFLLVCSGVIRLRLRIILRIVVGMGRIMIVMGRLNRSAQINPP